MTQNPQLDYSQGSMSKLLIAIATVVVIALLAALGYFIFQNQKLIKQLSPSPKPSQLTQSPQTQPQSPSAQVEKKLTRQDIEKQVEASLNSKNYQALSGYMTTPKVNFSLMSTECCEPMTPNEAASQMNYIGGGEPFTFDQQNPTILNLKAKNPQLAQAFIGLSSAGEQLAAFTIDASNKISAIQLSISYKLYTQ